MRLLLMLGAPLLAAAACTQPHGDCFNSTCCTNGFGCYKRQNRQYAQCRPLPAQGCADVPGWECPGWELCAGRHGDCTHSKCCKDKGFGCFRRPQASYAQCLPLPDGVCTDTAEWKCPGWELCSDNGEACTNTHCCADDRFACYERSGPHFLQCMRRGSCVPGQHGVCQEAMPQMGQCSGAYQDCHLSGCCLRAEDHCYLKNEGYGKCMPHCDPLADPSWLCKLHELPSERAKLMCDDLRLRENLYHQQCEVRYQNAAACNGAYFSSNNNYRPCVWREATQTCEENGQTLHCDCELIHKGCPVVAHKQAAVATGNGGGDDGLSGGEASIVALSVIIIIGGCCGLAWYLLRPPSATKRMVDEPEPSGAAMDGDDDIDGDTPAPRRKKKGGKKYNTTEMDMVL